MMISSSLVTSSLHLSTAEARLVFQTVPPSIIVLPSINWEGKTKGTEADAKNLRGISSRGVFFSL